MRTMPWVNNVGIEVFQKVQGSHIVAQRFKHGCSLTKDTVASEDRILLLKQECRVIRCVSWGVNGPGI